MGSREQVDDIIRQGSRRGLRRAGAGGEGGDVAGGQQGVAVLAGGGRRQGMADGADGVMPDVGGRGGGGRVDLALQVGAHRIEIDQLGHGLDVVGEGRRVQGAEGEPGRGDENRRERHDDDQEQVEDGPFHESSPHAHHTP